MGSEKFCLRWNDFESNISGAFKELRDDKDFFDVTLACEDEQIQAHKVILSACSPFFRNILRRHPNPNPLLYLKGVKYTDIQAVLNFMYHGEVNVAQEELNSFLAVAEDLRVKGLTQNKSEMETTSQNIKTPISTPTNIIPKTHYKTTQERNIQPQPYKRLQPVQRPTQKSSPSVDEDIIETVVPIKSEPRETHPIASHHVSEQTSEYKRPQPIAVVPMEDQSLTTYQEETGYEDYEQYDDEQQFGEVNTMQIVEGGVDPAGYNFESPEELLQFVGRSQEDNKFECTVCGKFKAVRKGLVRNHIESIHFPGMFTYSCNICEKEFQGRNALAVHNSEKHPSRPKNIQK